MRQIEREQTRAATIEDRYRTARHSADDRAASSHNG
jgi:hypothetical protein